MQLFQYLVGISTLVFTATASQDVGGNRWVNLTALPSPRQEHITVAVDNSTIAVLGGVERIGNNVRLSSTPNNMVFRLC